MRGLEEHEPVSVPLSESGRPLQMNGGKYEGGSRRTRMAGGTSIGFFVFFLFLCRAVSSAASAASVRLLAAISCFESLLVLPCPAAPPYVAVQWSSLLRLLATPSIPSLTRRTKSTRKGRSLALSLSLSLSALSSFLSFPHFSPPLSLPLYRVDAVDVARETERN